MDPLAILDSKETRNEEDDETLNSIVQGGEGEEHEDHDIDDEPIQAHRLATNESGIVQ